MAHEIPLTRSPYKVDDAIIPGNSTSETPVIFHLSPAGGADLARIKSIVVATLGLTHDALWNADTQKTVAAAFQSAPNLFNDTVEEIEHLSVPCWMAKKKLLIPNDKHKDFKDDAQFPITTGVQFSIICGYVPGMAFVVAMEIAKLSKAAEEMDARFFGRPSGSSGATTRDQKGSSVRRAPKPRAKRGTAAKR